MGLGKTVEILSLVLSHPWTGQVNEEINFRKIKDLSSNQDYSDCTACFCDSSMDVNLDGDGVNTVNVLVQCDVCCNWQHSSCVDFDAVNDKDYICYRCLLEKPISCGTTLIILPETLLYQWMEEISKHTDIDSLKIMLYSGVAKSYINPLHIALYDIVLVTYEVIRKELDRVHHHDFMLKLRHRKSYVYSPSPLLAINWWRICLDEAQLVETSTSKAAEMTHRLRAVNRWCVTGTPVQKDLCDILSKVD
jgi:E3 ubiquitin-protein ligase SHPRH